VTVYGTILDAAFAAMVGGTADQSDFAAAANLFAVPDQIERPGAPAGAALGLLGGFWLAALPRVGDWEKDESPAKSAAAKWDATPAKQELNEAPSA
jgi:hypothetical protein